MKTKPYVTETLFSYRDKVSVKKPVGLNQNAERTPLGKQTVWQLTKGNTSFRVRRIANAKNKVFSTSFAEIKEGTTVSYRKWFPQKKLEKWTSRAGNTFTVRTTTKHGTPQAQTETESFKAKQSSKLSADLSGYFTENLNTLEEGKTLSFDLFVPNRMTTYSFDVKSITTAEHAISEDSKSRSAKFSILEMKPSSFLVRAVLNPMFYTVVHSKPPRIVGYKGRSSIDPEFFGLSSPKVEIEVEYMP